MDGIKTTIEASLSVPGLTAQFATYEMPGPGTFQTADGKHYLNHLLTPWSFSVRVSSHEPERRSAPFTPAGHFQFLPTSVPIQFRSSGRLARVAQCVFDPDYFERTTGSTIAIRDEAMPSHADVRNCRIRGAMVRIEEELAHTAFDSLIVLESVGRLLMVEIARQFRSVSAPVQARGSLSGWQVKRIQDFVQENCCDGSRPSIQALAELCEISPGHLMRSFKATSGETLHSFVARVRLEKARDLLRTSQMSLKRIAAASGFGTQSHFSHSFHKFTGETPSRYRARVRANI